MEPSCGENWIRFQRALIAYMYIYTYTCIGPNSSIHCQVTTGLLAKLEAHCVGLIWYAAQSNVALSGFAIDREHSHSDLA